MNIVILARKPALHFNKKIEQLAKAAQMKVTIVDPLICEMYLEGNNSQVLVKGKPLPNIDFVIPRMGPAILDYGLSVLRQFELMGIPVLNSSMAINNSLKRYEYLQILSSHPEISVPKSVMARKSNQIKDAIQKVGGPPAMLKVLSSSNNLGAMMINDVKTAESFLDVNSIMGGIGQIGQSIVIEEFIKESEGKAINVLVLNGEILGAHYKVKAFNFKQSTSLINKSTEGFMVPDLKVAKMAVESADVLGLDFAMISLLESFDGPKVFEVSFNPKVEIFDKAPEVQIHAKILSYITNKVRKNVTSGVE